MAKRKRAWHKLLDSGRGRGTNLIGGGGLEDLAKNIGSTLTGTSIFDPVLCEVLINWFSKRGDAILDPFAGGSVRGIVSSFLDREYHGNDLSAEQIDANRDEFAELKFMQTFFGGQIQAPVWTVGDSRDINEIVQRRGFDMLLTCPPYYDLEQYTDDPRDISNMEYDDFLTVYREIFKKSVAMLKDDAFIVVVVGEVRDKGGYYRTFIGDTIQAVEATGARYYNEIILITITATAGLRAPRQFNASRKVVNMHQKALVFFNSGGDPAALKEYMTDADRRKIVTPMKRSILVFLRGNQRLAKDDFEKYSFDWF